MLLLVALDVVGERVPDQANIPVGFAAVVPAWQYDLRLDRDAGLGDAA